MVCFIRSILAILLLINSPLSMANREQIINNANHQLKLLPPWHFLHAELKATLGGDPCVHVNNIEGIEPNLEINIDVCSAIKAAALTAFVTKNYNFGNLNVTLNIIAPGLGPFDERIPPNATEVAELLSQAFTDNKYFVKAGISKKIPNAVFIEFKPQVVQFYSDDISDWYLNTNLVAAKAFSNIMNFRSFSQNSVSLYATTSPISSSPR